jgi:hypothetical protein
MEGSTITVSGVMISGKALLLLFVASFTVIVASVDAICPKIAATSGRSSGGTHFEIPQDTAVTNDTSSHEFIIASNHSLT